MNPVQNRATAVVRSEPWPLGGAIWLLLAVFGVGCSLTADFFPSDQQFDYGLYTVVATLACGLFIVALRGPLSETLPRWIIFVIFVWGYFVQFYWLVLHDDKPALGFVLAASLKPQPMLDAYRQGAIAFLVSGVTLNFMRIFQHPMPIEHPSESESTRAAICRLALFSALFIFASTTLLMVAFGFGSPTRELNLPFRIAGWVMQTRKILLPAFLLTIISVAHGTKLRGYYRAALIVFMVSALIDMVLITTRAGLVLGTVMVFSLLGVQQRISRQVWIFVGAAILATGALFPYVSQLRDNRVSGMQTYDAVAAAQVEVRRSERQDFVLSPLMKRFTGMNALIPIVDFNAHVSSSDVLRSFYDFTVGPSAVTTSDVFLYGPRSTTAVGPSMLGWLYIAGGELGEYIGCVVIMLLVNLVWRSSTFISPSLRAVFQSLFALYLLTRLSDGTLEDVIIPTLTIGASILILATLVRVLERQGSEEQQPRVAASIPTR
jgi:hypothetical protein